MAKNFVHLKIKMTSRMYQITANLDLRKRLRKLKKEKIYYSEFIRINIEQHLANQIFSKNVAW